MTKKNAGTGRGVQGTLFEAGSGTGNTGQILEYPLEKEMEDSYLNYAMSVIVGRALPDARDGLKPVQRRILYAMLGLGLRSGQPYKKSARIVGETMGKYHPHGDAAIYDAMARMSQDFSMSLPLVEGQGNFGSIDGDAPAAMRYTEARLGGGGEEMLADISEDVVGFRPNFDESLSEPETLPSKLPNLIINGASGIAVGMATNIPPHNPGEAADACRAVLDDPGITPEKLLEVMPGPDFPTGGEIVGRDGILEAYKTGRGRLTVRGKAEIHGGGRGRPKIVITEIPYAQNKTTLIEAIAKCVQAGLVTGVQDVRDESGRDGIRIVVELYKDASPEKVLDALYQKTPLQTTFGAINLALAGGRAKELPLREMIDLFLGHRREVVRRRTQNRLAAAREKLHIIEGLLLALSSVSEIVEAVRSSSNSSEAVSKLVSQFGLSEAQAKAVLEMRLQRLTGLEKGKLEAEKTELERTTASLLKILSGPKALDAVIKAELKEVKAKFGRPRRTKIIP